MCSSSHGLTSSITFLHFSPSVQKLECYLFTNKGKSWYNGGWQVVYGSPQESIMLTVIKTNPRFPGQHCIENVYLLPFVGLKREKMGHLSLGKDDSTFLSDFPYSRPTDSLSRVNSSAWEVPMVRTPSVCPASTQYEDIPF